MVTTNATKTFLDWMHSTRFEDIPADGRHTAVLALSDDTGCNLACSLIPLAHRMVDYAKLAGGQPDCTIVGFPSRLPASHYCFKPGPGQRHHRPRR